MRRDGTADPFTAVLAARMSRRELLRGGVALAALPAMLPLAGCAPRALLAGASSLGFTPIAASSADALRIPEGYESYVLGAWGDPIGAPAGNPVFRIDASNSAAEQALQMGMHHDGMRYYPLPLGADMRGSTRGLLAINHEYEDEDLLYPDGRANWTAEKTAKGQAAVGVSVVEAAFEGGRWRIVRPSRYARRVSAATPIAISGPAAGHPLLRTAFDASGRAMLGTLAGCSHGWTPWGTFLSCEENFNFFFSHTGRMSADEQRYRMTSRSRYNWFRTDERFDATRHPNEANRFGWVTEIDPFEPGAPPVKRTAFGRFKREGAAPSIAPGGRIAFYSGDDEAFEYIYKFVTRDAWNPRERAANRDLLDHGTLYVARFDADGSGSWLPLVAGTGPLSAAAGFASQAEVVIRARQAADALGATPMDRPEWMAVHPQSGEVYCTLTLSTERGAPGRTGTDAANPRGPNPFGHIIRWREAGGDPTATRFVWDIFALGGVSAQDGPKGDAFGCPDGLAFDDRGILWVGTDCPPGVLNRGPFAPLGNNQLLAVDPRDGSFRRFLTGPRGCEITGITFGPDDRTLFVNIQHPGESERAIDPANPRAISNWPDFDPAGRPRSATVVVRKTDGGRIGS